MEDKQKAEENYWLWLCSLGLYRDQMQALLHYFGSPEAIYLAPRSEFAAFSRYGMKWAERAGERRGEAWLDEMQESMARCGARFVSIEDAMYPDNLRQMADPPYGLFYRGTLPPQGMYSAAIVGARACTPYGAWLAAQIGEYLAQDGMMIISGLALGIDGIAQKAAVQAGGRSYGVLGCGVERCYPRENIELFGMMQERGGILSEFPCGMPPLRPHFPIRNRIISGLADAVIVVEARSKSGSLITAQLALEQGREVYALPGRSGDVLSGGCNELIARGEAALALSPENLLEELRQHAQRKGKMQESLQKETASTGKKRRKGQRKVALAPDEELVYSYLDLSPVDVDSLVRKTGLHAGRVKAALVGLELHDLAAAMGKNQFVKQ